MMTRRVKGYGPAINAVLADSGRLSSSIHVATSLALSRAGEQSAAATFNRIARRLSARLRDSPKFCATESFMSLTSANLGILNKDYGRTSSR
jgi:hypothetical protein